MPDPSDLGPPAWSQVPGPQVREPRSFAGERPGATPGQVRRAKLARGAWRAILWFGRTVAAVVRVVLFTLIGVVAVLVPWAIQRVLWLDPLGVARPRGSRWVIRRPTDPAPSHPWERDPALRRPHPLLRVRTVVAVVAVLAVLSVLSARSANQLNLHDLRSAPAYQGVSWWPEYTDELAYIGEPGTVWNPYDWQKVHDVRTHHINVRGGERATWVPPACDCPTVTLWLYGGSTTFGFGQRDEHTIASELARLAHADGVRLIVRNRGVPGDAHWEESRRFTWDLTRPGGERPDLVAFYDGVNDVAASFIRNGGGHDRDDQPVSLSLEATRRDFSRSFGDRVFVVRPRPPGASPLPTEPSAVRSTEEVVERAVTDYDRARVPTEAVAVRSHVPVTFFWQPFRASRPPSMWEVPGPDDQAQEIVATARRALADDVVDLSDALSGDPRPMFYDSTHTNELGARLVAEAMYEHLEPQIAAAAGRHR